jgi:hypothetical protein
MFFQKWFFFLCIKKWSNCMKLCLILHGWVSSIVTYKFASYIIYIKPHLHVAKNSYILNTFWISINYYLYMLRISSPFFSVGSSLVSLQKKSRGHVKIGYYLTKQVVNFKSLKLGVKYKTRKIWLTIWIC